MSGAVFALLGMASSVLQLHTVLTMTRRPLRDTCGRMALWLYVGAVAFAVRGEIGWTAYSAAMGSVNAVGWWFLPKEKEHLV